MVSTTIDSCPQLSTPNQRVRGSRLFNARVGCVPAVQQRITAAGPLLGDPQELPVLLSRAQRPSATYSLVVQDQTAGPRSATLTLARRDSTTTQTPGRSRARTTSGEYVIVHRAALPCRVGG